MMSVTTEHQRGMMLASGTSPQTYSYADTGEDLPAFNFGEMRTGNIAAEAVLVLRLPELRQNQSFRVVR
jgi:hypothetical protein